MSKRKAPLEICEHRVFSEELKRKIVKNLVSKRTTPRAIVVPLLAQGSCLVTYYYFYANSLKIEIK